MDKVREFEPKYIINHGKEMMHFFCSEYKVNPNNRFSQFIKRYEIMIQKRDLPVLNSDKHINLLAGFKDFVELDMIYSTGVYKDAPVSEFIQLFKGNTQHRNDAHTKPRDIQFQYSIAALLQYNGYKVKMCEPDFLFQYDNVNYPVAAKRISSKTLLEKRIKEAEKQISIFNTSGVIALSIDNLFKPEDQIINDKRFSQTFIELDKRLRNYSKQYFFAKYFEERKNVSAFFLNSALPVCTPNSVYFGYVNHLFVIPIAPENSDEFLRFRILAECLRS